eukprot:gene1208-1524_t
MTIIGGCNRILSNSILKRTTSSACLYFNNNGTCYEQPTQQQQQEQKQQPSQEQKQQPSQEQNKPKAFYRRGYFDLIKFPITAYVTFTAVAGYVAACPVDVFSWSTLGAVTLGTFLSSSAANIHNQDMEVKYDAMMTRTKNRPLVTGEINRDTAFMASISAYALSMCVLTVGAHPVSGALAVCNVMFYILYTGMKRVTPLNTWVGAIVGAVPPLIGSVAATGAIEPIGATLAGVLFFWQIPHFLALAELLKNQYSGAGYKMLSVTHPQILKRVSIAHSIVGAIFPLAMNHFYELNLHPITIAALSLNCVVMGYTSVFKPQNHKTARLIFIISLFTLPISLIISILLAQPFEYYQDDNTIDTDKKIVEIKDQQ